MENVNYTFKEICDKTGYTASAIRYYEKEFKIPIPRDTNGRRLFSKTEFDKLLFIKELQEQGFANSQIKRILEDSKSKENELLEEVALTNATSIISNNSQNIGITYDNVIQSMNKRFNELNDNINKLNQNVIGKERDLLISENMKLKMEIKRKSYEIIELKENLRFFKEKNINFLKRFFKKKS